MSANTLNVYVEIQLWRKWQLWHFSGGFETDVDEPQCTAVAHESGKNRVTPNKNKAVFKRRITRQTHHPEHAEVAWKQLLRNFGLTLH